MRARARVVAEPDGRGGTRFVELSATAPFALRATPEALFLVGAAQALLGEDELALEIRVAPGATLQIRSTAATVAYASQAAHFSVSATVGERGALVWWPEPLIATRRCRLRVEHAVELAEGATLDWTDETILGRVGEEPGELDLNLRIDAPQGPLVRHQLLVGDSFQGWDGPAGLDGARAVGLRAIVGRDAASGPTSGPGWAVLPAEGGGLLAVALGRDLLQMRRRLCSAGRSASAADPDVILDVLAQSRSLT